MVGRVRNRARCPRFVEACKGAEKRSIAADEVELRLRDWQASPLVEVVAYTQILQAQWWVQTHADGGFASGEDSETYLLEIETNDGRSRRFLVTPKDAASARVPDVLRALVDRGQLPDKPRDGGRIGEDMGTGMLVMLGTCSWCAGGLIWLLRYFGAGWELAAVGGRT
ncbi:MAG: hypothetical protein ABJE95_17915 [Byssovorax sp.]